MKQKTLIAIISIIFLSFFVGTCFADSMDLKAEMNNSLDKSKKSIENVTNDVFSGNNMMNEQNNSTNNNDNNNNTNNYNATRTSIDQGYYNIGGMNTTAWVWTIVAIASIIVIAVVWYYAMQGTNHDDLEK